MAIFANGPGTQTTAVTTSAGTIYSIAATGMSGTQKNLTIFNAGTVTAFLGSSTVTATTGFALAAGSQLLVEGPVPTTLFAITSALPTTIVAAPATIGTTVD
jgi:hypothetical protein